MFFPASGLLTQFFCPNDFFSDFLPPLLVLLHLSFVLIVPFSLTICLASFSQSIYRPFVLSTCYRLFDLVPSCHETGRFFVLGGHRCFSPSLLPGCTFRQSVPARSARLPVPRHNDLHCAHASPCSVVVSMFRALLTCFPPPASDLRGSLLLFFFFF